MPDGRRFLNATWQPVIDSKYKFYVYSAYLDKRILEKQINIPSPRVRVVGVARLLNLTIAERAFCRYWYDDEQFKLEAKSRKKFIAEAVMTPFTEHHGLDYSACFIDCLIAITAKIPTAVSVYSEQVMTTFLKDDDLISLPDAGNFLPINIQPEKPNDRTDLVACVKPLYSEFVQAWKLIEWIELNKILGFSHFYIYYHNSTKEVKCVLDDYVKNGTVTLFQWQNLPFKNNVDLREENMFAALNDCALRSINVHKYVAPFDVDEFIVTKNYTLLKFLEAFDKRGGNEISFVFQLAFFYLQWPDDSYYSGVDLTTQKKTKRRTEFKKNRGKYICKPEGVAEIGNHFLWKMTKKKYREVVIKPEFGNLFHYRNCERDYDNCWEDQFIEDRTMWKYQKELEKSMKVIEQNLAEKCKLCRLGNI
ncbi:beta-1,4-galactosyltransferase galt-1-like [Neocloeon triangulifer]|uniref:beta-1,4-galactosyltransferase galt-1-like n=1 Tax=Neocloeon triangulifer TaxID=2078957 RepID=UPI00286F0542|nr:beta-1,4-galactosyltransferase galt-1-like [Neocloeon triangulifer]